MTTLSTFLIILAGLSCVSNLLLWIYIRDLEDDFTDAAQACLKAQELSEQFNELWNGERAENETLRPAVQAKDFMLRQLRRDNAELEEKLHFQMIRTGHLAGQLCECRGHLNPVPRQN